MPIGDEHIIAALVAAESERRISISKAMTINGTTYQFEKRELHPEFSMVMPKCFGALAPECLLLKYPNVNRPKNILSNADASVTYAFELMPGNTETLETRLAEYKSAIKKMHPNYVFFYEEISKLESGLDIVCYDFRGVAIDNDIYCLNFFTDTPAGELFGWFSCPIDLQKNWEPLFRQMTQTIEPLILEENNGRS